MSSLATPDWKQTYLAALAVRDRSEKSTKPLYDKITTLNDENARLAQESTVQAEIRPDESIAPVPPPVTSYYGFRRAATASPVQIDATASTLRADFLSAQSDRVALQAKLDIVNATLVQTRSSLSMVTQKLKVRDAREKVVQAKLRDREEELRGKARLLDEVQDENAMLNMQLTVASEREEKLKKENRDLVDRWMVRVGKEVDRMNNDAGFQ